jgi:hypothetical protein
VLNLAGPEVDGASRCHSCIAVRSGDTIEACGNCTACCTARQYNLVWTSSALSGHFGLKPIWEAPLEWDSVYSLCLQNGALT